MLFDKEESKIKNHSILFDSIKNNDLAGVLNILSNSILDNHLLEIFENDTMFTPLHCSVLHNYTELSYNILSFYEKKLSDIEFKNFVNTKCNNKDTAINYACYKCNTKIFLLLLEKGADITIINNSGLNLFHISAQVNFLNPFLILNFLIDISMLLNAKDYSGSIPLHWASYCGSYDVTEFLINYSSNFINNKDNNKITPIHLALLSENSKTIKLLLKNNADTSVIDYKGRDIKSFLLEKNKEKMFFYIEEHEKCDIFCIKDKRKDRKSSNLNLILYIFLLLFTSIINILIYYKLAYYVQINSNIKRLNDTLIIERNNNHLNLENIISLISLAFILVLFYITSKLYFDKSDKISIFNNQYIDSDRGDSKNTSNSDDENISLICCNEDNIVENLENRLCKYLNNLIKLKLMNANFNEILSLQIDGVEYSSRQFKIFHSIILRSFSKDFNKISINTTESSKFANLDEMYFKYCDLKLESFESDYCFKCLIEKDEQFSHCDYCKACIKNADHHCFWVNNCISQSNYTYFSMFLAMNLGYLLICIVSYSWVLITFDIKNKYHFNIKFNEIIWIICIFLDLLSIFFCIMIIRVSFYFSKNLIKYKNGIIPNRISKAKDSFNIKHKKMDANNEYLKNYHTEKLIS